METIVYPAFIVATRIQGNQTALVFWEIALPYRRIIINKCRKN